MFKDTVKRNKYYHNLEYDHHQEGDICLVACGMERVDPSVTYGPDLRECYHLHAVLSGKGTLKVNGKVFSPHFGQLFILKDNEVVEYTSDAVDPWEYCWVTFNGTRAEQLVQEIGFTDGVYCLDSSIETKEFYKLILRMHEKPEMNYTNDLRRRGILLEFIALALDATAEVINRPVHKNTEDISLYIDKAIEFIHYNYETITVTDVFEFVGFSRSYFSNIFRKQVGISLQQYLIQYRMKVACKQLLESNLSINEISARVGYENQLTFSKAFHKMMNCSPSEYRKKATELADSGEEKPNE